MATDLAARLNGNGANDGSQRAVRVSTIDASEIEIPGAIVKRDGRVVPFEVDRIENALARCFASFDRTPSTPTLELANRVVNILAAKSNGTPPTVE